MDRQIDQAGLSGFHRRRKVGRRFIVGVVLVGCLVLAGGLSLPYWLARAIVAAPNRGRLLVAVERVDRSELARMEVEREIRVTVGPPDASLSMWVMAPPHVSTRPDGQGGMATVLVLHGMGDSKRSMVSVGKMLMGLGYRAVLIDLRGQGSSTGNWLTYGVRESADLVQVLDALTRDGFVDGAVGVYGASYGAATAIQLAGRDVRVRAVVAVAPFARMRDVVPVSVRHYLPGGRFLPDGLIHRAIDRAGAMAGFQPDEAEPVSALGRTSAGVLLIHGRRDARIPVSQSELLAQAAGDRARLIVLEEEDHDSIMRDRSGVIARETAAWFGEHLKGQFTEITVPGH